jgi:hypothetical protein
MSVWFGTQFRLEEIGTNLMNLFSLRNESFTLYVQQCKKQITKRI